jgi:hypothetical protein
MKCPICVSHHVYRTFFDNITTEEERKDLIDGCGDQGTGVDKMILPFTVIVEKSTRTILGVFKNND